MQNTSDIVFDDAINDTKSAEPSAFANLEKRVSAFVSDSAEQIKRVAAENPRTTIAAGAALVAGAVAAAAIPAIRASQKKPARKTATKSTAAKPAAKRAPAKRTTTAKKATA